MYVSVYLNILFSKLSSQIDSLTSHNVNFQELKNKMTQTLKFSIGILSQRQWLDKMRTLKTTLNIPPFAFTGDLNNAIFPLLNEASYNSYLLLSLGIYDSIPYELHSFLRDNDTPVSERSSTPPREETLLSKRKHSTEKFETDVLIPSHQTRSSIDSHSEDNTVINEPKKEAIYIGKRKKKSKRIVAKASTRIPTLGNDELLEYKLKFNQLMQKNEYEFQKFCQEYQHSLFLQSKENINANPTAIFGPCPFPNIKLEPLKTYQTGVKTEIPLKFPWNGIFDQYFPLVKWKNPSIFFHFEQAVLFEDN